MEVTLLHLPFLLLMDTLRSHLIVCSDDNPAVIAPYLPFWFMSLESQLLDQL